MSETRFEDINQQRLKSIEALRSEREVLVQVIEAQTELALHRIHDERLATMNHLEEIVAGTVDSSFDRVDVLTDRLFFRGLILVVILALALLVAGVVVVRMMRPRPVLGG